MEKIVDILGSVGFDWRVALANLVNFALVFALVARFIIPSVRRALNERHDLIEKGLTDAAAAEQALAEAAMREEEIVRDATLQATDLIAEARTRGDLIVAKAHDEGALAGTEMLRRAEEEIGRKQHEFRRTMEREAAVLIADGVRMTLAAGLDDAGNDAYIERVIARASSHT